MNKKVRRLKFAKNKGEVVKTSKQHTISNAVPKEAINRADVSLHKLVKRNSKKGNKVGMLKGGY